MVRREKSGCRADCRHWVFVPSADVDCQHWCDGCVHPDDEEDPED